MKGRTKKKFGLFVWSSGEIYWGGWQGFVGVFRGKGKAMDRLFNERNRQNNKAQLVDYKTLRVIANYEKKEGRWNEVKSDGK